MPTPTDLGRLVKQRHPGEYDDLDDAVLGRKVLLKYPDAYKDFADTTATPAATPAAPQAAPAPQPQQPGLMQQMGGSLMQTARDINSMMPAIGGAVGSTLGGLAGAPAAPLTGGASVPGGVIGGGMLGAGTGRAIEQGLAPLLGQPEEAASSPQQFFGNVANSAMGGVIPGAMETAIKKFGPMVATRLAQASIRNGYGDPAELANTMLKYGINNTRGGLRRIQMLVDAFGKKHAQAIAEASAKEGPIWNSTKEILDPIMAPLYDDAQAQAFPGKSVQVLKDLENQFTAARGRQRGGSGPDMTIAQLNRMKELADSQLRKLRFARNAPGTVVPPERDLEERALENISNRARELLYGTAEDGGLRSGGIVDHLADLEKQQSKLLMLKDNIGPTARKQMGSGPEIAQRAIPTATMAAGLGMMAPGGAASHAMGAGVGALAGAAATTPQALSGMALLMSNPALAANIANAMRVAQAGGDVVMSRSKSKK